MIPPDLRIAVLILGAALCLAAILAGMILRAAVRTRPGVLVRVAVAVGGAALMLWALVSYLSAPTQPAAASTVARASAATVSARDLVGTAATALEACPVPTAPPVPDSAHASFNEMKAAHTAFEAYDAATNAYTQCVDTTIARTSKQFAGVASESDLQALSLFGARAHNAAIDQEKAVVDQFNVQLRAYLAKHPK